MQTIDELHTLIVDHETWLMERVLAYAKRHDYTQYTSQVRLEMSAPRVMAEVDSTRIQQMLMNLALNARDAMPDGGILTIRIAYQDGATPTASLVVRDTGCGIPEDVLPHIFEPFFTTKEVGQGTGLGLAQVYGIVKQHGGEIDVATDVGSGTTFTVTLPALTMAGSPFLAMDGVDGPVYRQGDSETILVVEDDEPVRQALVAALEMLSYRTLTAPNGKVACDLLLQAASDAAPMSVDLVLTDLVMSPMGGDALVDWMENQVPGVPVVVLTGFPLDQQEEDVCGDARLRDLPVRGWVQKPINLEQLSSVIAHALATAS